MNITLEGQKATILHVNPRSEHRGDELEPAVDLKIAMDVSSDFLAQLSPSLKGMLFFYNEQLDADLADRGSEAPHLRYPALGLPLKWEEEMPDARVEILFNGARKPLVISPAKVNSISLTPRQGATVSVEMRIQFHPDESAAGRLATSIKQEVSVSISEAPEEAPEDSLPGAAS